MQLPYVVVLNRTEYVWNGKGWYCKSDYMKPPISVLNKLNQEIEAELESEDEKLLDPFDSVRIMDQIALAKECGQRQRMERLLTKAYEKSHFKEGGIASMLSSYFREINRPSDALAVYEKYGGKPNTALLTSRAAALCDVGRYAEALKQVRAVLGMSHGGAREALGVYSRIKKEAPILFEGGDKGGDGGRF